MLGASVTAGAGSAVAPGRPFNTLSTADVASGTSCSACAGTGLPVDAGIAYSAVVTAAHEVPRNYGDGATFIDPLGALREQAVAAAKDRPTVVIAVDWLFWPVHQSIPMDVPAAERDAQRLDTVDAALAELDRLQCPIVIGDVPEMKQAQGGLLKESNEPGEAVRAEVNRRLEKWAAEKPNRLILSISALADAVSSGAALEVAGFSYQAGDSARLLQRDGLHATPEGLVVLMAAAVDRLQQAGLVEGGARRLDLVAIAAAVEQEAAAAKHRARPQLLDAMSVSTLADTFRDAFSTRDLSVDDSAASAALEQLLARFESFSRNPAGELGWVVDIGFDFTAMDLEFAQNTAQGKPEQTLAVFAKHWHRLKADALADTPNPWHFDLWLKYAAQPVPGLSAETVELLAARRRERGPFPQPYASMVWQCADNAGGTALARCFPDPDEAYQAAMASSPKQHVHWDDRPTDEFGLFMVSLDASGFVRYLESRKAAGLPDVSHEFRARAEADVFKGSFAAIERLDSIDAARRAMYPRWPALWFGPAIAYGNIIARSIDQPSPGTTPDLSMRVPFTHGKARVVRPWLGFGWMENLDGAGALMSWSDGWIQVITRAEVQADGSVRLRSGQKRSTPAATVWYDAGRLGGSLTNPYLGWRRVGLEIPLESPVDRDGFASAVRRVVEADLRSPSADSSESVVHWPIGLRATGSVARATVRIPMGWDNESNAPRWATVELKDQPLLLLGVLEREDGKASVDGAIGDDLAQLATSRLRLHAVWEIDGPGSPERGGLAGNRATGEIVSMEGFVPGTPAELSEAIHEKADAGAEVQLWWRPVEAGSKQG